MSSDQSGPRGSIAHLSSFYSFSHSCSACSNSVFQSVDGAASVEADLPDILFARTRKQKVVMVYVPSFADSLTPRHELSVKRSIPIRLPVDKVVTPIQGNAKSKGAEIS